MPAELLSVHEASRRYGKDRRTIQRKITRGDLKKRTLKNGDVGISVADLETAFGARVQGGGTPLEMPPPPLAAEGRHAARGGRRYAASSLEVERARLEASLEAERKRITDLEEARRREIQAKNDHIDGLVAELEAAREERKSLHLQIADARRHETERARLAPPSSPGDVIEGTSAEQPGATEPGTKKPPRRRSAAPSAKPEPRAGWWSRLFG